MLHSNYEKLIVLTQTPEAIEQSVDYLQTHMRHFLKENDQVLILLPDQRMPICRILEQAILKCDCTPVWAGEDQRWMTLLKTAFTTKCSCIVGRPLTLLGLSKLAKHMETPLFVTNVLMVGYPTTPWIVEGVRKNLDCMAWGCFDPLDGVVIGGFTCKQLDGAHIRSDVYSVEIEDEDGLPLLQGEPGRVILYPNAEPELRVAVGDRGRLVTGSCACGSREPKLVDVNAIQPETEDVYQMGESLLHWSSILDCRLERTEYGMKMELVVFPGEKLPKLPTVAQRILRSFDPEKDMPFEHQKVLRKGFSVKKD